MQLGHLGVAHAVVVVVWTKNLKVLGLDPTKRSAFKFHFLFNKNLHLRCLAAPFFCSAGLIIYFLNGPFFIEMCMSCMGLNPIGISSDQFFIV